MAAAPLLLADWGTSNRRAWLIGADGERIATFADDRGMARIAPGGWPEAYEAMVAGLGGLRPRLALLAGMAGANRGWSQAPYIPCPAGLDALAARLHWVVPDAVAIAPGLSILYPGPDVMRGEEVQALGAVASGLVPSDALTCHPGTHSKWVRIEASRIVRFRTVMTGELFALLQAHSLLAEFLAGKAEPDGDFLAGVDHGFEQADLTAELFRVRARILLGAGGAGQAPSYVSGLLIGAELRVALDGEPADVIHIVGGGDLVRLYAAALGHRGRRAVGVDGEAAVLAGMARIAERLK